MGDFAEAFALGIVYGFGPCMTSCAPVLVPIVMTTSKGTLDGLKNTLLMGLGRLLAYIALGVIFGFLGTVLDISIPNWVLGVMFIALGVALIFKLHTRCILPKRKLTGAWMCFLSGILMGLSPCAPMLGMLALAAASKSVVMGAGIAFAFGLATMISPMILIGLAAGRWSTIKDFASINNYIAGGFLILMSIFYFIR